MSRRRIFCIITILAVIIISIIMLCKSHILIAALLLLMLVIYVVNHFAVRNLDFQKVPFQIQGEIRNVDYLIIGDMIDSTMVVPSDKSFVQIKAPNRSLNATFEILKHTSSILDEDNGNVIIVAKKDKSDRGFSVFDVPFLCNLTVKKYGIEKIAKLSKFPFLVKPFSTLKLLLNIINKNWKEITCPNKEIIKYCDERSFQLRYYEY